MLGSDMLGSDMSDESAADFAGEPDGFERLWTPHRMVYIEGENKPPDGTRKRARSAGSRPTTTRPGCWCTATNSLSSSSTSTRTRRATSWSVPIAT
ncbi:hypothetical protein GCM10027613_41700 [Microlunatus endophyticus]